MTRNQRNNLDRRLAEMRVVMLHLANYGKPYKYYMEELRVMQFKTNALMNELEREEIQLRMEL